MDVYELQSDLEAKVKETFNEMMEGVLVEASM